MKNVNSGNVLYDMIVLMFNYSNNIEEVPTALNNDIKTEYNDFLNETTTATFRKEGLSLKKSLESVPGAVPGLPNFFDFLQKSVKKMIMYIIHLDIQ